MKDYKKLIMKVRDARDLKNFRFICHNISQKELAYIAEYSKDAITSMETHRRGINRPFLLCVKDGIDSGRLEKVLKQRGPRK